MFNLPLTVYYAKLIVYCRESCWRESRKYVQDGCTVEGAGIPIGYRRNLANLRKKNRLDIIDRIFFHFQWNRWIFNSWYTLDSFRTFNNNKQRRDLNRSIRDLVTENQQKMLVEIVQWILDDISVRTRSLATGKQGHRTRFNVLL